MGSLSVVPFHQCPGNSRFVHNTKSASICHSPEQRHFAYLFSDFSSGGHESPGALEASIRAMLKNKKIKCRAVLVIRLIPPVATSANVSST